MRNKFLLAVAAAIIILIPQNAYAQEKASASSASIQIPAQSNRVYDSRAKILKEFLKEQDSPLASNAEDFVSYADKFNLDWKLVAAISGVESTFGKAIPPTSYNGWGWGVYGDNVIRFTSWENGIATVSQGIRERYMNAWGGKDIYQIGAMYASSPAWAGHVQLYLDKINDFALSDAQDSLSLSLSL
jgi:hypothetical protein